MTNKYNHLNIYSYFCVWMKCNIQLKINIEPDHNIFKCKKEHKATGCIKVTIVASNTVM